MRPGAAGAPGPAAPSRPDLPREERVERRSLEIGAAPEAGSRRAEGPKIRGRGNGAGPRRERRHQRLLVDERDAIFANRRQGAERGRRTRATLEGLPRRVPADEPVRTPIDDGIAPPRIRGDYAAPRSPRPRGVIEGERIHPLA